MRNTKVDCNGQPSWFHSDYDQWDCHTASQEVGEEGNLDRSTESHDIKRLELEIEKIEGYQEVGFPPLYVRLARLLYYIRVRSGPHLML